MLRKTALRGLLALALVAAAGAASAQTRAGDDEIVGTWKLLSMVKLGETGEVQPIDLGWDEAAGFIIYTPEERMMVFIGAAGREPLGYPDVTDAERAMAHKTMAAYTGTYEFHGDHVVHHIDHAWLPDWEGKPRRREAKLDGDRITLTTPLAKRADGTMARYELIWQRVQ